MINLTRTDNTKYPPPTTFKELKQFDFFIIPNRLGVYRKFMGASHDGEPYPAISLDGDLTSMCEYDLVKKVNVTDIHITYNADQ